MFISSILEPGKIVVPCGQIEDGRSDIMLLPRLDHKNAMQFYLILFGYSLLEPISHKMRKLRLTHGESTYGGHVSIFYLDSPAGDPDSSHHQVPNK